jgi:hypothetical protein
MLLTLTASCQDKNQDKNKKMKAEEFEYESTMCSPVGYPVDVYEGGLGSQSGEGVDLYLGTHYGPWGATGRSMGRGVKPVPRHLDVTWLSYAEDTFYTIDCDIDYDKMVKLFKEGYQSRAWFLNDGRYQKDTYNAIIVGFAPGGVVVVWLNGIGRQVEIGRYQGKKVEIPQSEVAGLDAHERLLFDEQYRKETMLSKQIVPLEVQEANKNKPIPYGLWDSYRERYSWRPIFAQRAFGDSVMTVVYTYLEMFNGEFESLFDQSLVENEFTKRAIPKYVNFAWKDKTGQVYSGTLNFDQKEIFDAYKEIYKDNKDEQVELVFQINIPNTFITVMLKSKNKEVHINKGTKVEVFKSRKKYLNHG